MGWFRRVRVAPTPEMATWAPLGFVTIPDGRVQRPDRPTHVPRTMVGDRRKHPGLQLRNGVGQLGNGYDVPTASGVPYWQTTPVRNPADYTRFGGGVNAPAVSAVIDKAKQDYYAGQDIDGNGPKLRLGRLTVRAR